MDYSLSGSSVHGIFQARNTGVGCHTLLQRIFLTQGSSRCLLCLLHWQVDSLPLAPPGRPTRVLQRVNSGMPRACALSQEKPPYGEAHAPQPERSPHSPQLEREASRRYKKGADPSPTFPVTSAVRAGGMRPTSPRTLAGYSGHLPAACIRCSATLFPGDSASVCSQKCES